MVELLVAAHLKRSPCAWQTPSMSLSPSNAHSASSDVPMRDALVELFWTRFSSRQLHVVLQ